VNFSAEKSLRFPSSRFHSSLTPQDEVTNLYDPIVTTVILSFLFADGCVTKTTSNCCVFQNLRTSQSDQNLKDNLLLSALGMSASFASDREGSQAWVLMWPMYLGIYVSITTDTNKSEEQLCVETAKHPRTYTPQRLKEVSEEPVTIIELEEPTRSHTKVAFREEEAIDSP
jgi:hypothetical protein